MSRPLQVKHLHTDVLIIGGGTAGCYAALTISRNSDASVLVAEKANIKRSGCLAAGVNAINAYIVKGRKPQDYVDYATKDAAGIVRNDLLLTAAEEFNEVTADMEKLGLVILKDENGDYVARGNRNIKINGENFKPLLADAVYKSKNVDVLNYVNITDLLTENGSVYGAVGFSIMEETAYVIHAKAVLIATSLAAFVGTMLMAFLANYPFALAPGMGLNAYFAYTVVLTMGYSWQMALLAVFVEGIVFIILSLTNVREAIFNAIPMTLKSAVSVGIGLFIAFVGLQNAKLIVNSDSTLLTYQHFKGETFHSVGVGALLALIGVLIIAVMLIKQVKGAILYGILITWVLGIVCELAGIYIPDPDAGMYSVIPTAFVSFDFSSLGKTFGQVFNLDFSNFNIVNFIVVMFAFLFVDLFDTLGTLIGVASKADMLDEDGKLPRIKGALLADAVATSVGAVLGTSTTTTYVESSSGVTVGGRTGLTATTTAVLFLLASIFSPLFLTIPSFATAPALIVVGFYMMGAVAKINFDDMTDAIPAFLTILVMPLAYSISEGIAIGIISWTLINVLTGKAKEKKITPLMYVLTVLFILKYIFL